MRNIISILIVASFICLVHPNDEIQYVLENDFSKQSMITNPNYQPVKSYQNYFDKDVIDKPAKGCRADAPTLSVYDIMMDDTNWISFKKKNKIFILGISNSECETCCQNEPLLRFMQGSMKNKTYSYKGKKIPIARIDTSKKQDFL